MVDAEPFGALRYDPAVAGTPAATSAPAYDDVGRFDYARHRTASPYTVLELLAGEGPDGYRAAGAAYQRWRRTGVLVEDDTPAYYLYEIHELRGGVPSVLRGVLAAVAVDEGNLLPHEAVDEQRVTDRLHRLAAVPAELAPVFAVHTAGPPVLRAVLDAAPTAPPIVAFTDEYGADHRIWALRGERKTAAVREGLRQVHAVIADGHHRYAAARARMPSSADQARTLTYLVDGAAYGPQLNAVHRLIRPLTETALAALETDFVVIGVARGRLLDELAAQPATAFGLLARGSASLLVAREPEGLSRRMPVERTAAWHRLDAAVWDTIVRPTVAPAEVIYRSDVAAATAQVDASTDSGLFLLRPASLADVFACAEAGEPMPAKTTWFRPKPRAGLIMRSLDSS